MRLDFTSMFIVMAGAFVRWSLSGWKGSFNDWMSRRTDTDVAYYKNYWTGIAIFCVVLIITFAAVRVAS